MKQNKYEFDPELRKIQNMNVPIKKGLMPMFHFFLEMLYLNQHSSKKIHVKKYKIKSFDNKKVKFLVYTPKNVKLNDKCLYFIHGGGFAFNSSPHHYKLAKIMAEKLECKCVYVNYRLAPKYKYPVANLDCYSVYKYILNNREELNIDPTKIILMGDSAGGNLAVSTTIRAHNDGLTIPKAQILLYPALVSGIETESKKSYTDTPMCNAKDMKIYHEMFYGNQDMKEDLIYKSPYFAEIFDNFPSTYIEVAEYDALHDDGLLFYKKLQEHNINSIYHEVKKAMHGYDYVINSNLVKILIENRVKFIKENVK